MKERIGDALRNAAMRFGAALDLWHKGDLHLDQENQEEKKPKTLDDYIFELEIATEKSQLDAIWLEMSDEYKNALLPKFKEKSKSLQQMKAAA